MQPQDPTTDWLYRLKRQMLLTLVVFLAVSITITLIFIVQKLRSALQEDSRIKTHELGLTVTSSLRHLMIMRVPGQIQDTLENMAGDNRTIVKAFIIDGSGRIAYSSDPDEVGIRLDPHADESCRGCHRAAGEPPRTNAILLETGGTVQRNVTLIYNDKECHGCHAPENRMNGKLIIDRSMESTASLVTAVEIIIFGSGLILLVVFVPLVLRVLSRGLNRYITEIFQRNQELKLLYLMVERLSRTLDMDVLKEIVVETFRDILGADEVFLALPRGEGEASASLWVGRSGKLQRFKVEPDTPLARQIDDWQKGRLDEAEISPTDRQVRMPIRKNRLRLALIVANKSDGTFDPARFKLLEIIRGHISVAFDNARLYTMAITDELTGLYTKRHFRNCLEKEFDGVTDSGNNLALLMVDLDDFKKVNDTYGHLVGDSVLKDVGQRILLSLRDKDMAFRYGGEEFAILLPSTDSSGAVLVAERIRSGIAGEPFRSGPVLISLTTSVGFAVCPGPATIHDLILAADEALYEAKGAGKDRVVAARERGEERAGG